MINKALTVLKDELSSFLKGLSELGITTEEKVSLSELVNQEGNLSLPQETLGMTLVSVEEERVLKAQASTTTTPNNQISHINPELKINLYILITANFNDYPTGLTYLSAALRCFQSKTVFNAENTPALDSEIEKLIVELYTLNLEQQHHLWGLLGSKYMPSLIYKVRMLTIQEYKVSDVQPPIRSFKSLEH